MKKTNFLIILMLFIQSISYSQVDSSHEYDKHVIHVKFNEEDRAALKQQKENEANNSARVKSSLGVVSIDNLNQKHRIKKIRQMFTAARPSLQAKHARHGLDLWYEIEIDDEVNDDLLQEYANDSHIAAVEPVYGSEVVMHGVTAAATDPDYHEQWGLYNDYKELPEEIDYVGREDIDMNPAWDIETGASNVIVAILESGGIDYDHEDLADAMWVNEAEANGVTGVDDDGNGHIDDIYGMGFSSEGLPFSIIPSSHATGTAGIVGAVRNNGIGIAGIAGGDGSGNGVRLMSVQTDIIQTSNDKAEGFIYAADNGAVIVNNSWGFSPGVPIEKSLEDAIDYFIATAGTDDYGNQVGPMKGGVVIFSAGNENGNFPIYPAAYEPVIAVAATNRSDARSVASGSSYGDWVDISAPGELIYTTENKDSYGSSSGTSFAGPHVAGVAALLVSKYQYDGITPEQVREALINSTDPNTGQFAGSLGSGRVDAYNALTYPLTFSCATETFGNNGAAYEFNDQIEFENFDQCSSGASSEGSSYFEADDSQDGDTSYRPGETVDIYSNVNNGTLVQGIGWVSKDEYWTYTFNVPQASVDREIQFELNAATPLNNRKLRIEIDGVSTTLNVTNTGGWDTFQSMTSAFVTLPSNLAGEKTLKVTSTNGNVNLDWIRVIPPVVTQVTFGNNGNPWGVGIVEAENFDALSDGSTGQAICYNESDTNNSGDQSVRPGESIDIFSKTIGGANVVGIGWNVTGEWLEYTVDLPVGNYTFDLRAAGKTSSTITVEMEANGATPISGTIPFVATGSWTSFSDFSGSSNYNYPGGTGVVRVYTMSGMDFDKFEIIDVNASADRLIESNEVVISSLENINVYPIPAKNTLTISNKDEKNLSIQLFDIAGNRLVDYQNIDENTIDLDVSHLPKGIYMIHLQTEDFADVRKIMID